MSESEEEFQTASEESKEDIEEEESEEDIEEIENLFQKQKLEELDLEKGKLDYSEISIESEKRKIAIELISQLFEDVFKNFEFKYKHETEKDFFSKLEYALPILYLLDFPSFPFKFELINAINELNKITNIENLWNLFIDMKKKDESEPIAFILFDLINEEKLFPNQTIFEIPIKNKSSKKRIYDQIILDILIIKFNILILPTSSKELTSDLIKKRQNSIKSNSQITNFYRIYYKKMMDSLIIKLCEILKINLTKITLPTIKTEFPDSELFLNLTWTYLINQFGLSPITINPQDKKNLIIDSLPAYEISLLIDNKSLDFIMEKIHANFSPNLKTRDFSNIFTTQKKEFLPIESGSGKRYFFEFNNKPVNFAVNIPNVLPANYIKYAGGKWILNGETLIVLPLSSKWQEMMFITFQQSFGQKVAEFIYLVLKNDSNNFFAYSFFKEELEKTVFK